MPMYEYQCGSCGHHLTARQGINDARLTTCPECGADELQRLISQTSFVLKGGGWYASGYQKSDAGASTADAGTSTSGEGTADSSSTSTSTTESTSAPESS